MKSIVFRIFLMLVACVGLCAIVLTIWADIEFRYRGPRQFHQEFLSFLANECEMKWEQQDDANHQKFHEFLTRISMQLHSDFQWFDREGTNLTGKEDRPDLKNLMIPPDLMKNRDDFPSYHIDQKRKSSPFSKSRRIPPHFHPSGQMTFIKPTNSGSYFLLQTIKLPKYSIPLSLLISIAIILLIFGSLIYRQIARPVLSLENTVNAFGSGQWNARSTITRKDEIGRLAVSFNHMADLISQEIERERKMVRNIAHEVRNPLTRMALLLERVRNGKNVDDSVSRLESEIQTLGRIPNLLIYMADIEQGRAQMKIRETAIQTVLNSHLKSMEPLASQKRCQFQFPSDPEKAEFLVNTDPELLGRCLDNVLENAIRFAPEGSTIDVELTRSSDQYLIQIRDYGPGVREEELDQIFQPFFRSDESRNKYTGGLGLGLSITVSAMKSLGGRIRAQNASPGLLIVIELPVRSQNV
jgi:two-component system sensor histidine kinase CpxA